MPFYHQPKTFTPLLIAAEKKAIKKGVHHAIFTSRFDKYIGDWNNDLKEGKGLFLTITGKLYEGDWHKGFRHGYGSLSNRHTNGTFSLEYRGEWVRGKPQGIGWWYYQNGDIYFGFFKKGQRHGYGKMWYNDGTFYVGYWNKSRKEGLGMFVQENNNRYEGHWSSDQKHGLGRFYHLHSGQLQEGCWLNDICIRSKMSDIIIRQFCELPTEYPIPQFFTVSCSQENRNTRTEYIWHQNQVIRPNMNNEKDAEYAEYLPSIRHISSTYLPIIKKETLQNSQKILEHSEIWLEQRIGEIDKKLLYCIDKTV